MLTEIRNENLVSIVMPAFRAEKTIAQSINSVIEQSYPHWELLIVDDCSPDRTCEVVSTIALMETRVQLICSQINGGPAVARNKALSRAKGRWIAFLDSDDLWLPAKLEETIKYALLKNAALTFTGFKRISSDGVNVGKYISVPSTLSYHQLLGNTAIATSTVLIDRSKTDNFVMKKTFYDDFACWLEILEKGNVAHGLNKDLMRYRVVTNSVSRNKWRSAKEVWINYREIQKLNIFSSAWHFSRYACNALYKYRNF